MNPIISNRVNSLPVAPVRGIEGLIITHRNLPFFSNIDEVVFNEYQPISLITNEEQYDNIF